jgi:HipA-like C-terminal domain
MKPQAQALISLLQQSGALASPKIQSALRVSQPTVSRLLAELGDQVFTFGAARATRYALGHSIGLLPAQQPIWAIGADAMVQRLGALTFLARSQIHIGADGVDTIFEASARQPLPWLLSGLRPQGFLGRLLAQRMAALVSSTNPDTWSVEEVLAGACQTHDAPGALLLGTSVSTQLDARTKISVVDPGPDLDRLSSDVARTLPTGSSAAGERPKLLACNEDGASFITKFSAPRGTPYGDRWSDLLVCESLGAQALNDFGMVAAPNAIVQTASRTYLLSQRFDRVGLVGRKHVVSVGAAHAGFCNGTYANWAATCSDLARQKRLSREDADTAHDLLMFGRLIGNTDMHSGNAGLYVEGSSLQELMDGRFALAPVYDMLPMRWKPDAMLGMFPYEPFEADYSVASNTVRSAAKAFWQRVASHPLISMELQRVAAVMGTQIPTP